MRIITLASMLALVATPVGLFGQEPAGLPLIIPQGPMCTPTARAAWQRVDRLEEGAEVRHATRHGARTLGTARQIYWGPFTRSDNYMALAVENQTLCGHVFRDQRYYNDGLLRFLRLVPERDWNLFIEPDPRFRALVAAPWPPLRPCSKEKDRGDDRCVETEVTPHEELRDFVKPLTSLEDRSACVYGVHVYDAGHEGGKPEIHPTLAVWLDFPSADGIRRRRAYVMQDGSRRFDKDSYFLEPRPEPWSGSPLEMLYLVAVRIPAQDRIHIEVRNPLARGLTPFPASGQGNRRPILRGGVDVGTLEVFDGFERFASISARDFCQDGNEAIGYLEIGASVVGAEIGTPGFAVIDVLSGPANQVFPDEPAHPVGQAVDGELAVVPGSLRDGSSGLLADFSVTGQLAEAFAPVIDLQSLGAQRPQFVETTLQDGGRVRLVTGVPVSGAELSTAERQQPLASLVVAERSVPFPMVRLEVTALQALPELGEPDNEAWRAFLEQAGVSEPGGTAGLALHRVRRWTVETVGGYVPVDPEGVAGGVDMDLAYEANRYRADFLDGAQWGEEWRELGLEAVEGAQLSWDGSTVVLDPSDYRGTQVWDLSVLLPGFDEDTGRLASHVISLAGGDEENLLDLLRGPPVEMTRSVPLPEPSLDRSTGGLAVLDARTRAAGLGVVLRQAARDSLITLGELRSLNQLVAWWREGA